MEAPRWTDADALKVKDAVDNEADGRVQLVLRTLGGDRISGSLWVKVVPAAWKLGTAGQLTLLAGSVVVDPQFYTSKV